MLGEVISKEWIAFPLVSSVVLEIPASRRKVLCNAKTYLNGALNYNFIIIPRGSTVLYVLVIQSKWGATGIWNTCVYAYTDIHVKLRRFTAGFTCNILKNKSSYFCLFFKFFHIWNYASLQTVQFQFVKMRKFYHNNITKKLIKYIL